MIKLTNAHPDRRGDVLYINPQHIVSVYETSETRGGSLQTKVYGVTGQEWTVEESSKEVYNLINYPPMLLE